MKKITGLDKLFYLTQAILFGIAIFLFFVNPGNKKIQVSWSLMILVCIINIILIYVNKKIALIFTWLITSVFIFYYYSPN
jgi:hypothetical protein